MATQENGLRVRDPKVTQEGGEERIENGWDGEGWGCDCEESDSNQSKYLKSHVYGHDLQFDLQKIRHFQVFKDVFTLNSNAIGQTLGMVGLPCEASARS
jgi:hypothetical protein